MLKIGFSETTDAKSYTLILKQGTIDWNYLNTCSVCFPSVAIICRKRIAKSCIIHGRFEVSKLSTIDCRYSRICFLKLKLSNKLSLSHNWTVVLRILHSSNEYELRKAIS